MIDNYMVNPMFVGMIYEIIIIIIISILLILVLIKYREKKHKLTKYLFLMFLCYTISIVFTLLSKVLRLYSGLDYLINPDVPDPGTLLSWFLLRIVAFRFSSILIIIGVLFNYILKINLFNDEENNSQIQKIIVFTYAGFSIIYMLFFYIKGNLFLDIINFTLVLIFMCVIYIPFTWHCYQTYREVSDIIYKRAFLSLIVMSICLILVFVCQIIDRVLMIVLDISGYTVFYFLGWSFAILAILCAYLGYIKPKSRE